MKRIPPRVRVSLTLTLKCRVRVNKTVTQCPTAVHNDPTASIKLNFNINFRGEPCKDDTLLYQMGVHFKR